MALNRRKFLQDSAMLIMTVPALPGLHRVHALLEAGESEGVQPDALKQAFLDPPNKAWPWVYWFVTDGNLTREGITQDLEAMHRVGIRGVLYMEVDVGLPRGPVRFLSPQWRELIQHAVQEATRLGITVNMNDDGGAAGSGGPWITPELSMQIMVWSETSVQGPRQFTGTLPQPMTNENYYEDIAVVAFPTPAGEGARMAESSPKLTYGTDRKSFDSAKLMDGTGGTVVLLPFAAEGQPQYLNIEFPEPFTAQALTVAIGNRDCQIQASIEVSEDGETFRTLRHAALLYPASSVNFPKVTARYYRLAMQLEKYGLFDLTPPDTIPLGEVELHPTLRIEDIPTKAFYVRFGAELPGPLAHVGEPILSPETTVRREQVVDLTGKMDRSGQLAWDVPEGKWTVLRIGHTSTGSRNAGSVKEGWGLECDKLSKKAIEAHFNGLIGMLLADQAAVGGKSLTMTHIDSWENDIGSQNWTPGLREEFQKRCGYDLLPYLPILTGRGVESREISERFLWDLRRVIADLLLENYAGHMQEICHQHGITVSIEAYYDGPLDEVPYGGRADVPMSEFCGGEPTGAINKEMSSSGHVYGHPIIAAESFTTRPETGKWQEHPYLMKPLGDLVFTQGINRFVFHRYGMQPWTNRRPGLTPVGPWGIHYERTNTWFEQSGAWITYLARCQSLLQSGRFVADVAYLGSEDAPSRFPDRESTAPPIPQGYDFDDLPPEMLMKATVRDGQLVLGSGMTYLVLALPPVRTMRPALLRKIKELVEAGAKVFGPPPATSPSLVDYPQCDQEVEQLVAELWGDNRIISTGRLEDVLRSLAPGPDFALDYGRYFNLGHELTGGDDVRYIHRQVDGDDLYFVASALPEARRFLCTFRVSGKRPELWWPDTGRTEEVAVYDEHDGRTQVPLALDPCGSVFVIFRAAAAPLRDRVISVRRDEVEISGVASKPEPETQLRQESAAVYLKSGGGPGYQIEVAQPGTYALKTASGRRLKVEVPTLPNPMEIKGPWELEFAKGWGAPERVTLERLISWTDHPDSGVKYFSGIATYRRKFAVSAQMPARDRRLYLDLGAVYVIAQAKLNGHDLGTLWKPPFTVEVTDILRPGTNDLEVSVVNLWPNRLIGDEQLPPDCEFTALGGQALARYPQWLLDNKPSPTGRFTFTTWKHWTKDDPLLESGLLGPVRIITKASVPVA